MDPEGLFGLICVNAGWLASPWRIASMYRWSEYEGWGKPGGLPITSWNPFATTQPARYFENGGLDFSFDIGYGPGRWNNVGAGGLEIYRGVKVFATPEAGAAATAETIRNGHYPDLIRCFEDEEGYPEALDDFTRWIGSSGYASALIQYMQELEVADPRVDGILEKLRVSGIDEWVQFNAPTTLKTTLGELQEAVGSLRQEVANLSSMIAGLQATSVGAWVPGLARDPFGGSAIGGYGKHTDE